MTFVSGIISGAGNNAVPGYFVRPVRKYKSIQAYPSTGGGRRGHRERLCDESKEG